MVPLPLLNFIPTFFQYDFLGGHRPIVPTDIQNQQITVIIVKIVSRMKKSCFIQSPWNKTEISIKNRILKFRAKSKYWWNVSDCDQCKNRQNKNRPFTVPAMTSHFRLVINIQNRNKKTYKIAISAVLDKLHISFL